MTGDETAATPIWSFEVAAGDPRDRLDKLVLVLLERSGHRTSRAAVQRWIEAGRVTVDGAEARASASVRAGARIDVRPAPEPGTTVTPDPAVNIVTVFEDAHLVVVNKPAGLVVHPARGHADATLVHGLLARGGFDRAPSDPRDPSGHLRPGIVHRLDKGTSGLLVVAKDAPTREGLKEQFAAHRIAREYIAIVVGHANEATYSTLHARHPTDRLRFTSRTTKGRRAVTHVRVLERFDEATLVACQLETGRTHQIRVHLSERSGTPVLGDPLYGRPPKSPVLRALADELGHQALHARLLGFEHPATGAELRFETEPPADVQRAIERLRATTSSTSRSPST